jgi:sodium/potassium-transporting ATPase subunit alpha
MANFENERPPASRVQWNDIDVEDGARARPNLQRTNSNTSSRSNHSRRGSIDPASALPIQYRTVSFQINETKENDVAQFKKVKDTAAEGSRRRIPT